MRTNDIQSRTVDVMRFMMVVLVVILHSYTSARGIIDTANYPVYRTISFLCSLELAQAAVPGLFFISGFLFFLHKKPYKTKLRSSVGRFVVPYLLWNALIVAMYFCVENLPMLSKYFSGENTPIREYTTIDFLRAFWDGGTWDGGNGTPILHQFWYIRNLILITLFSPLIRLFVQKLRWYGVAVLIIAWLFTPGQAFMIESVAFFCAGACFSLQKRDFLPLFQHYEKAIYLLYLVMVGVHMVFRSPELIPFDRLSFILGLICMMNLTARFVRGQTKGVVIPAGGKVVHPYAQLRPVGFFLFAFHDPLLTLLKRIAMKLTAPPTDLSLTVIYLVVPVVVIALGIVVYRLLRRFAPSLLYTLTGR